MVDTREIARLRLAAQRVVGPRCADAAEAVRWLGAAQAQDQPGALTSIALRTAGRSREAVTAAMDAGAVVRSWPMRGTLHLVAAEDLGWLLSLTAERQLRTARARRLELGLDDDVVLRAERTARAALEGGGRLLRDELLAAWSAVGIDVAAGRGNHLLSHLAHREVLCFGPSSDGRPLVVLSEEWITAPRRLEREEALGELAERYLRSHGPATERDLARWCGLPLGDVRTGIAIAGSGLETVEADGTTYLMDPATPARLEGARTEARAVHLLPGFDEMVLGYLDRTATVPARFAERIVPGANGVFRPTVVHDGRAVGTWRRTGATRRFEAEPFHEAFSARVQRALPRASAALP